MRDAIAELLSQFLSTNGVVFMLSMLPISELRGAMIYAASVEIPLHVALSLSIIGNLIPILPILLLLGPVSRWCSRFSLGERFFNWVVERARS